MALKIKELEELKDICLAHRRFNKVQEQFEFQNLSNASAGITIPGLNGQDIPYYEAMHQFNPGNGEIKYVQKLARQPYNYHVFRTINRTELMDGPPPLGNFGHSKAHFSSNELLYKILRGDTKLVRSLCEANQF